MNEDVKLQDPIKWVIKAKNDLENVDIHFTNKEWVKLLKTYIEETFETYRTKINNSQSQEKRCRIEGLSTESLDDEN